MSELKLLPCPFCGGEAGITHYGNNRASTRYECFDCGCSLETSETSNYGKRWNERAQLPDDLHGDVLALCDAIEVLGHGGILHGTAKRISERLRGSDANTDTRN